MAYRSAASWRNISASKYNGGGVSEIQWRQCGGAQWRKRIIAQYNGLRLKTGAI
jgi:hypothetical protein